MGQKMKNAPVYFTIAQVRFNTIWSLDSYAPTIQESMRRMGYPDAKRGILSTFNLTPINTGEAVPSKVPVEQTTRYTFANTEGTANFVLDQGSLSFQATEYDVFETFSGMLLQGLELIHSTVAGGLSYSDRVGVRYLDAVFPRSNETLADYLAVSVLGLVDRLEGELLHSFSETLTKTPAANVISRTIIQHGKVGFPADMQPIELRLPKRFEQLDGRHAIIDTDGIYEARENFDISNLKAKLIAVHDEIGKSFKATVTEHALDVWE